MEDIEAVTEVDWKENLFVWKGFTKVSYDKYNLAQNNGYHLMAISYTIWRNNKALQYEWRICIKEWEGVLGVTDKTAREILAKCEKFITKISGSHYRDEAGQVKQEANQYIIETVSVESNILNITNEAVTKRALDKAYAKVTDIEIKMNNDLYNQIFHKGTFWKFNGYKAWKETTCEFVKEGGRKKINSMRASENSVAGKVADRLEREYQEYLSEQRKQNELIGQKVDRHLDTFDSDNEEFISPYVKKEKPDIADFLED